MITARTWDEKIPTWAICYFVNNDSSSLNEEDIAMADKFWNRYQKIADNYQGVITINYPDDIDAEKYFCPFPSFGLACDAVDCTVTLLV